MNLDNQVAKNALKSKYPPRGRQIPHEIKKGMPVDSMKAIKYAFKNQKQGVSPGTGGLRPEFLVCLAEIWEDEAEDKWELVNFFCMQYVSGKMPPWFYKCVMTVETVGLYKTAEREPDKIRPIGMRNPWIKTIHKEVISQNRELFKSFLEPQQLGMSVAGAAKLVHCIRMTLENNLGFICVKLDFRNAFNEIWRARIVEALEEEETLSHLAQFAAILQSPGSGLESKGVLWGEAEEGVTQGDPTSGPFFCVGIQKFVRKADEKLKESGGMLRCGWDDCYILGKANAVFETLNSFATEVEQFCGLKLQISKSEIFSWPGYYPENAPMGFIKSGVEVEGEWHSGFICYGVPIGQDTYVEHVLDSKVDELYHESQKQWKVLESSRQSMWAILRSSFVSKLDYWLTLVYPSQIKKAAEKMDRIVLSILEKLLGTEIPMTDEGKGFECPVRVPISELDNKSFQSWIIRLPIKSGGLGLRSNVETSPAAFIGGVEQSLPHFSKENGVCPALVDTIGDFLGDCGTRWSKLINSNCRTGQEFQTSWNIIKVETEKCSKFLFKDLALSHLKEDAEGAGVGRDDGGTRRLIIQERDELRAGVLTEIYRRHNIPNQKQIKSWLNRDKLSSAWLLSLPGPQTSLSNAEFSEALALILGMPSPACKERLGEKIGRKVVDLYGDNVVAEVLPGDHWRTRHDSIKMIINSLCQWARVPSTVEVWGLFSHLIPAEALPRISSGRARQGLVPDFRLQLHTETGNSQLSLAELKVISCCDTWYKPSAGARVRGTDKRAQGLQSDYRKKAKTIDQEVLGRDPNSRGPVERRLDEFGEIIGLVFGPWADASKDVHDLVARLAESRLKFQMLQQGRPEGGSDNELAVIVGQIRRKLSLAVTKANVVCLLSKLHQVGPGNKQLAKKRDWVLMEDEKMKKERHAQWLRNIDGVTSKQKGMIKI